MNSIKHLSPFIRNHGIKLCISSKCLKSYRPSTISADGNLILTAKQNRTMSTRKRCLNFEDLNPNIIKMEYAVRGPLIIRAAEIEKELAEGVKKPFNEVIKANIGDCHGMGQCPITFIRQILALVSYPTLLDDPHFPSDAKEKARIVLQNCHGGSVGAYSDSPGIEMIRRKVADYIMKRDHIPSDYQDVFLCAGASDGIKNILKLLNSEVGGKTPAVMLPIPQYPLYSATLAEFSMGQVGYYLNEKRHWGLEVSELKRALEEGRKTCNPRALVIINPGNPTGQVLTRSNIEDIIKFAYDEKLFLFADEVYQHNIYAEGSKFFSFKKVLMELGEPTNKHELASFMSCSKGFMGECGLRGGYVEVVNLCPKVKAMYTKSISAMLCSSVLGQIVILCVVDPPKYGEPSYELFIKEKTAVLDSLKARAKMVVDTFNSMEGFSCNVIQGAMYAFPQFKMPAKAIEAAKSAKQAPDVFYAFSLLEKTGICIVPGSGFGQQPGTFHFRTTILPQPQKLKDMMEKFRNFHAEFLKEYS